MHTTASDIFILLFRFADVRKIIILVTCTSILLGIHACQYIVVLKCASCTKYTFSQKMRGSKIYIFVSFPTYGCRLAITLLLLLGGEEVKGVIYSFSFNHV